MVHIKYMYVSHGTYKYMYTSHGTYKYMYTSHGTCICHMVHISTCTHHMVHISMYMSHGTYKYMYNMSHGTYKYMYMIQNKCFCWALKHSCAHVESAKHFNQEDFRQLQCTKCVWDVVLFIYSHKYPEAKPRLLPWKQVSLPWKLA